jgi:MFS family permease
MSVPADRLSGAEGRELTRNFASHIVEGGLYIGGIAFVHQHTVLPRMLEQLGAPSILIAFAPALMNIGFIVPGLFVAHRIEQLTTMRGWVVSMGVWQRLPYLLAALMLWAAQSHPALALPTVLLAPLVSGLIGGVAVNAWKEYVASVIPARLRASMWAYRYVLGTLLGFLVGALVTQVLGSEPGPRGYALLHGGTFLCLALSMGVFLMTNERPHAPRAAQQSLAQFMRTVPALVRADRRFFIYMWARIPLHGIFIVLPFLGIHALGVLGKSDAFLGSLLTCNMVGSLCGFLLAGYSGDRHGGRLAILVAHLGWLAVAISAPFTSSSGGFQVLFGLLGASLSMSTIGLSTLDLEITPLERRVSFQAVLGSFTLLGLVSTSLLAALLRKLSDSLWALCIPAAVLTLVSLALFYMVEEPRRSTAA